jgi:hypothetical protein
VDIVISTRFLDFFTAKINAIFYCNQYVIFSIYRNVLLGWLLVA